MLVRLFSIFPFVLVLLACDPIPTQTEDNTDAGLVFLPWVLAVTGGKSSYQFEYHVFPGNLIPPGAQFAVKVKMVDETGYFFEDARGKVSNTLANKQETYYQVNWKIYKEGEDTSRLSAVNPPEDSAFANLDNTKTPLAAGSTQKEAVGYFLVGSKVPSGRYILEASVNDGDPTGQTTIKTFRRAFEVLPAFQFPKNLRLEARGGAAKEHTILPDLNVKKLQQVLISSKNAAEATASLSLRSSASSEKPEVFYYDFRLLGDTNYRITRYVDASLGSNPVTKITATADTHAVELTGDNQDPKSKDFPLETKGYAAWFTAKISGGAPTSDQGQVKLEVTNQYGQKGTLTVNLSAKS